MVPLFPAQKNPSKTIKNEKIHQNIKKKNYNENSTYSTYDRNYQNVSYSTYDNIEIIESSYEPFNSRNDAINIFIHIKNISR
jgi:radical SAM superfamily enzyme